MGNNFSVVAPIVATVLALLFLPFIFYAFYEIVYNTAEYRIWEILFLLLGLGMCVGGVYACYAGHQTGGLVLDIFGVGLAAFIIAQFILEAWVF
jgi:hypothetical protein